jgi:NADH-quinone oxidoreductase subunit E
MSWPTRIADVSKYKDQRMLTPEEIEEIRAEISRVPYERSACIEALKIVQRHRGWVSDESLRAVAEFLAMTPDELDGVATFYSHIFRKPVGRHVIRVCNNVSCWIMGTVSILGHLKHRLGIDPGETTPDGRFTLLPNVCLGFCHHAPAMMIGDELYGDLDPQRIDEILENYQ